MKAAELGRAGMGELVIPDPSLYRAGIPIEILYKMNETELIEAPKPKGKEGGCMGRGSSLRVLLFRISVGGKRRGLRNKIVSISLISLLAILVLHGLAMAQAPTDYKAQTVRTPDGLSISVQEWGNPAGPEILFIHGFAQSHLSWVKQTRSDLAKTFRMITYDNRGHGESDKPFDPSYYKESKRWADEVQTVIDGLKLKRPVLVGWSYGGRIISDYLTIYGQEKISGINYVDATTNSDPNLKLFGPGAALLGPMGSDNLEVNIAATRQFLRLCTAAPLSQEDFEMMLAFNMVCPAKVRAGMSGRTAQYGAALSKVRIPVLVTHGKDEQVVLGAMAEYTANAIQGARLSWYANAGHCTFWENPQRFNTELAQLVKEANVR